MTYTFTDIIKPRISDINYGGHLGHIELINLLHEVRVRFLNQHSTKETDINGNALVMRGLDIKYNNQAFWGNSLEVSMGVNINGAKIIFDYTVKNLTLKNESAVAEASMVLVDKKNNKPVKPDDFIRIIESDNNNKRKS